MHEAKYNLYDKKNILSAWFGIKEKEETLMFIIFTMSMLSNKARKNSGSPMLVYDFDEDLWIYSELNITDILKEKKIKGQVKIIKNWIYKEIKNIL